jgi:GT2 family glycosyltransferase
MMDLSVVIVSYNVKYYLEQCLRSVFRSQGKWEMEVFVVDNNSSDGSVEYLSARFPQVKFIANKDNRGFSCANNQALRQAKGRYMLLLNPDTILTENTLTDTLQYLDEHPEVGASGTAMYGRDGRFAWESRRGVPTPWTAFCKMVGLTALFPHSRRFGRYHMRYLNREEANYIEVISGAYMMLRREALEQVGLLDESFFMYGEDIDLSYRMLQGGWKNAYIPSPILHYKGESTQKSSYRYVHIFYEAMLIFFDKHFSKRYRLLALLIRLAVYLRAGIDVLKRLMQRLLALLPQRPTKQETILCVGPKESLPIMFDICQRNRLAPTTLEVQASEDIRIDRQDFTYILFDTTFFSYAKVLEQLIALSGKGSRMAIATYDSDSKLIILPYDVLS